MDNKLSWDIHINNIKLRLSKGISLLAKIRHYIPESALRSLYFTFINSHIDYNLLNWGTASATALDTVSSKTRKAIRIISFKEKDDPALPLFKQHSILPVVKNLELKQAFFMWKLSNGILPPSLAANFRIVRNQISVTHNRLSSLKTTVHQPVFSNSFKTGTGTHILGIPNPFSILRKIISFSSCNCVIGGSSTQ